MKKIRCFIPNILLTFLLVFVLIGCEASVLASRIACNPTTFQVITDQQHLDAKGYESLTSYFKTRSNSTGIPETVFLDAYSQQDLHDAIWSNCEAALGFLNGQRSEYAPASNFTGLEDSVRTFFEDYADKNGFKKDDILEEKIYSTCQEAEAAIRNAADPFKFSTLYSNGLLAKARKAVSSLNTIVIAAAAAVVVLLILLLLCNLKQLEHLCYWIGLAGFIAGGLMAAPCIYLTATDYYSSFAIKDPQIFSAVIGYLKLLTSRCLTMAIITLIVGLIGLLSFILLRSAQREEAAEK
jgi:hypothetical protein